MRKQVRVGHQGRLVIPAAWRKELNIQAGDTLIGRIEDGRLIFETRDMIHARLRERFRAVPRSVSLADELIEDRRAEARREAEE